MILLLLAACGPKEAEADPHWGEIVAQRAGETASVDVYAAFGFSLEDTAIVYLTANADASCDDAARALSGRDPDFDPTVVLPPGQCTLFANVRWAGGSFTDSAAVGSPTTESVVVASCAMDEGAWSYVDDDPDDAGFYYSGSLWQGSPQAYELEIGGGDGAPFSVSLSASDWSGDFLYEELGEALADGDVGGAAEAEWCEALGETVYF